MRRGEVAGLAVEGPQSTRRELRAGFWWGFVLGLLCWALVTSPWWSRSLDEVTRWPR